MQIVEKRLDEIRPYERNPRRNDAAVEYVAESIKQFGWRQPIVIDRDGVIIVGHTRLKAAQKLGLEKVPCLIADDLTPEQVKAYRIADNKTGEMADWDFDALEIELDSIDLDMSAFGFEIEDHENYVESFFDRGVEKAYKPPAFEIKVSCADQQQVDACMDLLQQNGYAAKQL